MNRLEGGWQQVAAEFDRLSYTPDLGKLLDHAQAFYEPSSGLESNTFGKFLGHFFSLQDRQMLRLNPDATRLGAGGLAGGGTQRRAFCDYDLGTYYFGG